MKTCNRSFFYTIFLTISSLLLPLNLQAQQNGAVVINEISWMGTTVSYNDEWLELFNTTSQSISLSNWTLQAQDGTPSITLTGSIPAGGYYLLERTDDTSVSGISANLIYTGSMENGSEFLELRDSTGALIDSVDVWHAGDNSAKFTMERTDPLLSGTAASNWNTAVAAYTGGLGTPLALNSLTTEPSGGGGGGLSYGTGSDWFDVYFSDNLNSVMPDYGPKAMANALATAIDQSTVSIDFALYGMRETTEIMTALKDAANRGVTVRGVVDSDAGGYYYYKDTQALIDSFPAGTVKSDLDDRIMHNKFFVFDGAAVWTGSTNLSETGVNAEYNANWSVLIRNADLAQAFTTEFNEMYAGSFHDLKTDNTPHTFPELSDGTVLESYFAPTDDATHNAIIRAIDEAQQTLNIAIFYLTEQEIADALKAAHDRGVVVRVILDSTGAENAYSLQDFLRTAGVPVKIENWGGKMHMKALSGDGHTVIVGSQNWTGAGNTDNDENTLYIRNQPLAAAFNAHFETLWSAIPDTWLAGRPEAESVDSIGSLSDFIDNDHDGMVDEGAPESLNTVSESKNAINVYFNKGTLPGYATPGNLANQHVNLENRLIERINAASSSILVATYEINLPGIVDALIQRAGDGVDVRILADAKGSTDPEHDERYKIMRLQLERLVRGEDGTVGTADDCAVFSDSIIFAVEDATERAAYGLPATPVGFSSVTVAVGNGNQTGYQIVDGESKSAGAYYSGGNQMHNKFVVIDDSWVWTGSWNFTVTGLYGSDENMAAGILGGNTQNSIEIRSSSLADIFRTEFNEMWGSSTAQPDPVASNFHGRKSDNTVHSINIGGKTVEVYFSPADNAVPRMGQIVREEAQYGAFFNIFAWSDQTLVDDLKEKWEGSRDDLVGTLTGFDIKGVFDGSFWNMWWSASVEMTGRTGSQSSTNNPNIRWANPAPVYSGGEDRKMHSKTMLIDPENPGSDPTVIVGSTNWSTNGNDINDENLLIIHDEDVTNQFLQEFYGRYLMAGGHIPD